MARRRMIDPNFWQSEDISKLSIRQRLLVVGLFSNADDEGKGRASIPYIRSIVFPYDDIPVKDLAQDLIVIAENVSICLYEVDGNSYYKFTNWEKWQRVDKPQPSLLPDPPESLQNNSGIIPESFLPKRKEEKRREEKGKEEKHPRAEFVFLTDKEHESLITDHGEEDTKSMIEILNNYKGSTGKNYKSDYLAIKNWVVKRLEEDKQKVTPIKPQNKARLPSETPSAQSIINGGEYEIFVAPKPT